MSPPEGAEPGLVLVADDEHDIVELVSIVLGRARYQVVTANEGLEALRLARELRPKLCILDGTMPGLPGFEILDQLRSDPEMAEIRVLILTATVDEEREIRRSGTVPDGFIGKPFEARRLLSEVARLIG